MVHDRSVGVTSCTFVIPTYNDAEFLGEALASLQSQTVTDWEAVVVDDGSSAPDAAAEVVRAAGDPRIRLLRLPENRGLAAARNAGIGVASSSVIVMIDADDKIHAEYLERVLPHLSAASGSNCVFTDTVQFGAVDHRVSRSDKDVHTLLRWQWIPATGVAIHRSLWEAVGGYWEDQALRVGNEDREFWIACVEHGLRPTHVREPLAYYRVRDASMSSRLSVEEWRTRIAILQRHDALFRQYGLRRAFLADGYLSSAEAVRVRGGRRSAIWLAGRALIQQPWRLGALGIIARALLPGPVHRRLRAARQRLRPRT